MPANSIFGKYSAKVKQALFLLFMFSATLSGLAQSGLIKDSITTFTAYGNPQLIIEKLNLAALHFHKAFDNRINFGFVGSEYNYIVLKLNSSHIYPDQYLSIDNTSLDTISIYRIYKDGTSRMLYLGGDFVVFNKNKNYVWHTVLVEISTIPSFYLIALKASQKNINVKYEILDKDDLQKKYQGHDRLVFFYIGIVCLITAIILLALILFKKAVFAAYLGYIILASAWIVSHYGYIFPFLYPQNPVINEIVKPVSSLGGCFFLILVLNLVFRQQLQSQQWLQQWIKCMLYILAFLTVSMLLLLIHELPFSLKGILIVVWHIGLIFSICITVVIPLCFIHSGATAKIFSLAMLAICIMSIVQLFANSGYIHNFFIEEHGMTMGSLLENSIMAFGLVLPINITLFIPFIIFLKFCQSRCSSIFFQKMKHVRMLYNALAFLIYLRFGFYFVYSVVCNVQIHFALSISLLRFSA